MCEDDGVDIFCEGEQIMKPIIFSEVADLFEEEEYNLTTIRIDVISPMFMFEFEKNEKCFTVAGFTDKAFGNFEMYNKHEKQAYGILKENGYIKE